jgi:hypothetical protein
MTIIPAIVNLAPAKSILEGVSPVAILNNSYPILIEGEALPHSVQQINAAIKTTAGRVQKLSPVVLSSDTAVFPWLIENSFI